MSKIIRICKMHCRIERSAGMDRTRHVEFDHLFPQGVPPVTAERRRQRFASPGNIGVNVATDESQFFNATVKFIDPFLRADIRRLRQLAYGGNFIRP